MPFIDKIGFPKGEIIGYTGIVLSVLLVFFGNAIIPGDRVRVRWLDSHAWVRTSRDTLQLLILLC